MTCHHATGGLLHHLLTLTVIPLKKDGGYFLLHYFTLTDNFPLRSGLPYVARTFLLHHQGASDKLSDCIFICKVSSRMANDKTQSYIFEVYSMPELLLFYNFPYFRKSYPYFRNFYPYFRKNSWYFCFFKSTECLWCTKNG